MQQGEDRAGRRRNSWGGPFWFTRVLIGAAFIGSVALLTVAFNGGNERVIEAAIGFAKWVILVSVAAYVARAGVTDNLEKFISAVRKVT